MASNKNQHFVPKCYLRPFTLGEAGKAINVYNIDREQFIEMAPVKNQCAGDYFYGKDPLLEKAIQHTEGAYATTLRIIRAPGYGLTGPHGALLKTFWLLQHMRTDAASRRAVEMSANMMATAGVEDLSFRLQIREAVLLAMRTFVHLFHIVDDLKVCLVRNRTDTPFVTSDDPAILTNLWHQSGRMSGRSFGLGSAGNVLLLPLTPDVLLLAYDGDVYSINHVRGWSELRRPSDVVAFNEHQLLNCRANVFVREGSHAALVHSDFLQCKPRRPTQTSIVHYAILDKEQGDYKTYRVVSGERSLEQDGEALIHSQSVRPRPSQWPGIIMRRPNGAVFTNGTGVGYVRRSRANNWQGGPVFRKQRAW